MTTNDHKRDNQFPVEFQQVSIGDETARLGIKVERKSLDLETADQLLAGKRLDGVITLATADELSQNLLFDEDAPATLAATMDVKRFGCAAKQISAGLTFNIEEIDVSLLSKFAKRSGLFLCTLLSAIDGPEPEADKTAFEDDGDE